MFHSALLYVAFQYMYIYRERETYDVICMFSFGTLAISALRPNDVGSKEKEKRTRHRMSQLGLLYPWAVDVARQGGREECIFMTTEE